MNPRLIAISGPMEGAFYALPAMAVTVGRDPDATLSIDEPSLAPEHCIVDGREGRFVVRSVAPGGATFVNGLPVEERELLHGDEVRIGECLFLFLTYESETPAGLRYERELERLEGESRRICAEIELEHGMVGSSAAMRSVYRFIARAAPTDSTVLIRGESGTGKELVARAIHRNSRRAARPFVAINCAAITETLLESELFGHERGAFTGAVSQKAGKLELASGGTVFLDEVGEMAPAIQAKLLRVLQEHTFERVGGTRTIQADLRIVAATNRDLVRCGSFRPDLYYRLNVVSILMPSLRQRRDDIPALAHHFVAKYSQLAHRRVLGISPAAKRALEAYDWPGNVRELENAIERAVVLGSTELILPEDLPDGLLEAAPPASSGYHDAVHRAKREIVRTAIEAAGGNISEAARELGLHPNNLHRLVTNLRLRGEA